MKRNHFTIILFLFSISLNAQTFLEGVWQRTSCSGGIVPINKVEKDTFLIAFKGNQYYEGKSINELKKVSPFSIKKGKSIFSSNSQLLIINERMQRFDIRKTGNKLSLVPNVYDGVGCSYTKISESLTSEKNQFFQIEFTLDFDKKIALKNIPKGKIQKIENWQTSLLNNNVILTFFDANYQVANAESLTVSNVKPLNASIDAIQNTKLKNGDTRLHFIVSITSEVKNELLIQISYNDKAMLVSVAKIASYKTKYNNLNITNNKTARMLDNKDLEEDCFQAALSVDSYSGDAKWKSFFYDIINGHSRFGNNFLEDNYFRSCEVSKNKKMKFNLRFFINKLNAG